MKKIILSLSLILALACNANAASVVPDRVMTDYPNTYGIYQVDHQIIVYSEPDEKSEIKQKIVWTKDTVIPQNLTKADLFVVYLENNDFGLMSVTDETEDWVEVIYNNETGDKGWIKKDDPYKFNTWVNFYSMYGKKYGLKILKGAPESINHMYGSPEDDARAICAVTQPEYINLNIIKGNWMLVTVIDADRTPKTGYMRWRSDTGIKYMFPNLK